MGNRIGLFREVFLAAATSLPEVAVVTSAIKAGAYTLAVGNIFGSNCFNMVDGMVEEATSLQQLLQQLCAAATDERVSVNAMLEAVGRRSFGPLIAAGRVTLSLVRDITGGANGGGGARAASVYGAAVGPQVVLAA